MAKQPIKLDPPAMRVHPEAQRSQARSSSALWQNVLRFSAGAIPVVSGGVAGGVAGGAFGLPSLLGNAISGGGALSGGDADFIRMQELFEKQTRVQMQMQTWSTESNIAKSRHDTRMETIRNMRA